MLNLKTGKEPEPGDPPTPIHTNAEKYYKIAMDSTSIAFALYMYLYRGTLCDRARRRRVNNFKLKALNFLRNSLVSYFVIFHHVISRLKKKKALEVLF